MTCLVCSHLLEITSVKNRKNEAPNRMTLHECINCGAQQTVAQILIEGPTKKNFTVNQRKAVAGSIS